MWAIIGDLVGSSASIEQTALNYEVPKRAVEAAATFYERNKEAIDARLRANLFK